jgi:hypothetical protein
MVEPPKVLGPPTVVLVLRTLDNPVDAHCCGLVLKCYELRTRQHRILNVNALRPSKHYFP